jgi:biopolymer transport protein TolR
MAKNKRLAYDSAPTSEINITPLIDIMLVLLIIFMVLTPIMVYEMSVNLPSKTETVEQEDLPKDQLVAAVCEDGSFALNRRIMDLDALHERVRKRLRPKPNKVVFIDGHPDASYERMVALMDTVRDAGADKIGIASLKEGEEFRACSTATEEAVEGAAAGSPGAEGGEAAAG